MYSWLLQLLLDLSRTLFYFYGLVCNYCYFTDSDDVVRFVHHQGTFMRLQKLSRKLIQKKFDLHLPKQLSQAILFQDTVRSKSTITADI